MDFNRELVKIASELEEITENATENLTGNYENYKEHINNALLFFIDSMFPSYSGHTNKPGLE